MKRTYLARITDPASSAKPIHQTFTPVDKKVKID